jgi:hypothetical protein
MTMSLIGGIIVLVICGVFFGIYRSYQSKQNLARALGLALLLVKIPRGKRNDADGAKEAQDLFRSELGRFEQLTANLSSLKSPVAFELAVPHIGEEIHFYCAVPKRALEVTTKQIQSLWNGASVEQVRDDYTIFNPQGAVAGATLGLRDDYALPLRTYNEIGIDTFGAIAGALTKVNEIGEGAAMQIVLRPAPKGAKKHITHTIQELKRGISLEHLLKRGGFSFGEMKRALAPEKEEKEKEERIIDDDAVKMVAEKLAKPLFEVNIRVLASAPSVFQAKDILDAILAGFEQFGSPHRNAFRVTIAKNPTKTIRDFIFRNFREDQMMLLGSEEVASLYHFPTPFMETPRLKMLKAKESAPPSNLPPKGMLLGESVFRGQTKPIYMTDEDRRRHLYIIGQTGTGKTTQIQSLVMQDMQAGKGVAVIDPHGELIEAALAHIPPERLDDVILFDPGDYWHPVGLNMLDYNLDRPEEKTFIVNEMQSIFNKLFSQETMGPMFEQYMRNALLLLMEDAVNEPATLIEVPRIFTDPEFRKRKLARITNPVVLDFWEKEAVKVSGEASLANMAPYITSKFSNFIANDYVRPIIGQEKSAFNFRDIMDSGKILLVNLSKGKIGDINANLLGMLFTGKLLMAALSRGDMTGDDRRDFYLYIDEFQNFATDAIVTIFSEARKYRLNLTVAHQFIAQLDEKIRDAVFGNVGSHLVLRVGVPDAEFLVKEFAPIFDENDLISIDNLNAYVRLLINGETSKPFNMQVNKASWAKGDPARAAQIREYVQLTYGADRHAVEDRIYARLRS